MKKRSPLSFFLCLGLDVWQEREGMGSPRVSCSRQCLGQVYLSAAAATILGLDVTRGSSRLRALFGADTLCGVVWNVNKN